MSLNDLDTVRDTLAAVHAGLKRISDLELASELIETALLEIAIVERRRLARLPRDMLDPRAYLRRKN